MGFVIVSGLAIGMVFAAVALVYNVMYSTSKVLSVTTGHLAMLGGVFGAWFISQLQWHWSLGLLGAMAIGAAFGWLTDLLAIRRVLARSDEHLWLLSTLALATMVQQGVGLWWGTEPKPFPRLLPQAFGAGIGDQKFWLPIVLALVMAIGLDRFYRRTMYGKLFLAMSEDAFAARARGVSTDRIRELSYILSGALGGLAGFAAGQLTFAYFAVGLSLTLNGFIALAVGGLGSNIGALLGGAALGLLNAFASYWIGGEYQNTIAVGLLMLVLLVKPEGLLGSQNVRPV
jgi:branched-chain amino acid transport system permease protein